MKRTPAVPWVETKSTTLDIASWRSITDAELPLSAMLVVGILIGGLITVIVACVILYGLATIVGLGLATPHTAPVTSIKNPGTWLADGYTSNPH
jgi:hypothetical protein